MKFKEDPNGEWETEGLFCSTRATIFKLPPPKVEWRIAHPGDGSPIICSSFEEAMDKWFEGFNLPYLFVGNEKEPFEVSQARVKKYFEDNKEGKPKVGAREVMRQAIATRLDRYAKGEGITLLNPGYDSMMIDIADRTVDCVLAILRDSGVKV